MNIDEYNFGKIVISGKTYTSDVIIYDFGVNGSWWRKDGHNLSSDDLKEIFDFKPDLLIIGTGAHGIMRVSDKVQKAIKDMGIKLIIDKTDKACEEYNRQKDKSKVVAALHLTC